MRSLTAPRVRFYSSAEFFPQVLRKPINYLASPSMAGCLFPALVLSDPSGALLRTKVVPFHREAHRAGLRDGYAGASRK